jgi:4,5:9,10-diseco-3-hydroxy-5,9,17-trioxoandrosta-1(10),2-diene-4-oate hydrolase
MSKQLPQDRYVKVGDINTRYWKAGDKGSAVVLVHGLGASIESWVSNIDVLAERYRVYAMDLPGHGRTDKLPLVKDLLVLVQFVNDFMDTQGIKKATLVGNSMGGGLVLMFAIRFPQKVEKLVLVSNAGMGRGVTRTLSLPTLPLLGELFVRPSLKGTRKIFEEAVFDVSLVTPEVVELAYNLAALPGAPRALLYVIRAGINFRGQRSKYTKQILNNLGKITAPTLIFWGQQDRVIPVAHAQIAASKIPGAKLHIFDKCGHCAMMERPDEFNKLVLDFLAES